MGGPFQLVRRHLLQQDTRVWVPKRPMTGSGNTLEFAHAGARTFIVTVCVVLGLVLPVVVLLALLVR